MSDVEDPEIYAAEPLYKWEKSEIGQWVMKHAVEPPIYLFKTDYASYGFEVTVDARLQEEDATYFCLKWAHEIL
jgi:hypothetical protein